MLLSFLLGYLFNRPFDLVLKLENSTGKVSSQLLKEEFLSLVKLLYYALVTMGHKLYPRGGPSHGLIWLILRCIITHVSCVELNHT